MASTVQCMTYVHTRSPGLLRSVGRILHRWLERERDRRSLARLDDRDLRDLGLSRFEIEREIARHYWD